MERFLGVAASASVSTSSATNEGEELTEDNVFWTSTDFTERNNRQPPPSTAANDSHIRRPSFSQSSGILAALSEPSHYHILYRKPIILSSSSTVKSGTMIPQPTSRERECSGKFRQQTHSAPVKVPVLSVAVARERNKKFLVDEYYDEDGAQEMLLPPHEIVARGSGVSPKTTFSVLEGVGRTLKGRDLRQVRNAIFRKTGFLD